MMRRMRLRWLPLSLRSLLFPVCVATSLAAPVELVPPDLRGAIQPQIAVASNGAVHVVFGKGNSVYHVTSADGLKFSEPVKIGDLEKLALGKRRGPRIVASDGLLFASAISHGDGNLHTWTSTDNGKTWRAGTSLNTVDGSAREGLQALAGDGRGKVVAVWLDSRSGKGGEVWSRVSRDGGKTWLADELVYAAPDGPICPCCVPSVAISPNGTVGVMWRNSLEGSRDLHLSLRQGEKPFSAAIKLGSGTWQMNGCPMDGGGLAFSPEGRWTAVWRRERTVFSTTQDVPETQLGANASQPVVAYSGSTPVLWWETQDGLMVLRGDAAPTRFAAGATSASAASGKDAASVVWEGSNGSGKTLLFDRFR